MPKQITCVNCLGVGHTIERKYDGTKFPRLCRGCNGSGKQVVSR